MSRFDGSNASIRQIPMQQVTSICCTVCERLRFILSDFSISNGFFPFCKSEQINLKACTEYTIFTQHQRPTSHHAKDNKKSCKRGGEWEGQGESEEINMCKNTFDCVFPDPHNANTVDNSLAFGAKFFSPACATPLSRNWSQSFSSFVHQFFC